MCKVIYRTALVQNFWTGSTYQLFASPEELLLYRVGGDFRGLKRDLLQRADEPLRPLGRRDLRFDAGEIHRIHAVFYEYSRAPALRIHLRYGSGKTFSLTAYSGEEDHLIHALRNFVPERRLDPDCVFSPEPSPEQATCNPRRAKVLKWFLIALMVLYVANLMAIVFSTTHRGLFTVLSLAPLPLVLLLYCIFPRELTLTDSSRRAGPRVRIPYILLLTACTPALNAFSAYDYLDWRRLGLVALLLFLAIMAAILILTREWKAYPFYLIIPIFVLLIYLPGMAGQLNLLPEATEPLHISATVVGGYRSGDDYLLQLALETEDRVIVEDFRVTHAQYNATHSGAKVPALYHSGWLGVPYAEIDEETWSAELNSIRPDSQAASETTSSR